ncbi:ubiquitin carboxyl-terminal hydrolase CYLD [Thalassophryne amazonica]|uniref:ubiquitin carboxyl-terminal hydrolase CYLD n=1 Tax=Thalassophryne amazonica TaxID=390379 RepID=UPI001470E631|nr:ubiquitin carboxyl-terminal hydrolase CYLD [Thalassophryne amazonica]XP_034035288.1 ubiquitin carboxyl-terminal hydrolase CYLD [Thalassophryne amazonica]
MASLAENLYFIITEKDKLLPLISPGRLCYITKFKYESEHKKYDPVKKLPVVFLPSHTLLSFEMDVSCMEQLSEEHAMLLLAVDKDSERLKWFRTNGALQTAAGLTVGTVVSVEEGGETLRGTIRYIGKLAKSGYPSSSSGTYFGIELMGADSGKGNTDGCYHAQFLFSCKKNGGLVVPFFKIRPVVPSSLTSSVPHSPTQPEQDPINIGDRVTYISGQCCGRGMVLDVQERDSCVFFRISTDTDENGKTGGEVELASDFVFKGEIPEESQNMDVDAPPVDPDMDTDCLCLGVNSLVEVTLGKGNSYGTIRWIGMLPDREEVMAGLELDDDNGVSDGTFKNERFFSCPPKRALFVKLRSCRPDSRFHSMPANHSEMMPNHKETENLEPVPPVGSEQVRQMLIGRMKGIQGHCNSCYMDAALFSLFACSSVLDSMLFKATDPGDAPIQKMLLHNIVNPLRSQGFVEGRHIMKLRQQLQNQGYSRSFTTEEKDPEEFLIVIMHHILNLEPLLKLSAGGKVQESYCYQIFLDQSHSLMLPTVQQLLEHSFHSAGLKLAEVPSCFILQMPRFGKKFKMFDKIIPSLELDITNLLSEGPQQCILCGNVAQEECSDCFQDPVFSRIGFKLFCRKCSDQVHSHPLRRSHKPAALVIPKGYMGRGIPHAMTRDKLELFAVLCIETSHYVSFIKYGPDSQDWIFFDSMADRQGESDGFNIPEVLHCPEVGKYLSMSPADLSSLVPRDMKGVAKRLFCDAYMYLYQNTSMCLYC